MFTKPVTLFRLAGFRVQLDLTWLILAVLITWSLATGVFPHYFRGLDPAVYWYMGIGGTLGLLLSIIMHEFSHSIVARRYGLPISSITLFLFGGIAQMEEEPPSPRAELYMAVAGPIMSLFAAGFFYSIYSVAISAAWHDSVAGVFIYLSALNLILAGFNLVPAFPLDGGRVLRAILWKRGGDRIRATRISSKTGAGFGIALIVMGVFSFLTGNYIGGMWYALIGLFVRHAAKSSYLNLVVKKALKGEKVRRFMSTDPVTVPPSIPVSSLIDDYVYRHYHKMFPVVMGSKLVGCVDTDRLKQVPKEEWNDRKVGDIFEDCTSKNVISPDKDAMSAMRIMKQTGKSRLLVVDGGLLVGIVTLKDIFNFLSIKLEIKKPEEFPLGL